jgi:poly(3-hydroxybutyrate) depolymerase
MIAAAKTDVDGPASGLTLHTFDMVTPSCGPLTRRYLELVPPGLSSKSSAPVLVVLHDTGRSAELMRSDSRWRFDDVAKREGFILVYANAAPGPVTDVKLENSGSWQSDSRTHPQVDDEEYLQRVLGDLAVRRVIVGNNDVYLAGYGGGAMMALTAAARQPRAYVGVAAILPPQPEDIAPPVIDEPVRLSRALFVLDEKATLDEDNRSLARGWARALGITLPTRERHWRLGTRGAPASRVEQLDATLPASGSAAVRLLVVERPFDAFPAAFARVRPVQAAVQPGRRELDGASDSWAFLSGADSVQPMEGPADEPAPLNPDGKSILPEDVGFEEPAVVFDDDVVAPPDPSR